MPICRTGQKIIFYAHIPKAAGSSIETYLRSKGPLSFYTKNSPPSSLAVTPQHLHRAEIDALFDQSFFDHSFAVLRDPEARLQSEYRWRATKKRGTATRDPGVCEKALRSIVPAIGYRPQSFDQWVNSALDGYEKNPWIYDNHIRPQAEFVSSADKLFLLEDGLDPVFDWLDEATGTPASSRGIWEKRTSDRQEEISPKTLSRLQEFYNRDYALIESVKISS